MQTINYEGRTFYAIPDYNDEYFMCKETQQILSLRRPQHPRVLKPSINGNGYYMFRLKQGDTAKNVNLHRIYAEMFLPNPDGLPHINHLDGNKLNNAPENLEWCTPKRNTQHAWESGLCSSASFEVEIHQYKLSGEYLMSFPSIHQAARVVGGDAPGIVKATRDGTTCRGRLWSYHRTDRIPCYTGAPIAEYYLVDGVRVEQLKEVTAITGIGRAMYHRRRLKHGLIFTENGFVVETVLYD